jgi:hypothetical protein
LSDEDPSFADDVVINLPPKVVYENVKLTASDTAANDFIERRVHNAK